LASQHREKLLAGNSYIELPKFGYSVSCVSARCGLDVGALWANNLQTWGEMDIASLGVNWWLTPITATYGMNGSASKVRAAV